jgi:hypothetical protein
VAGSVRMQDRLNLRERAMTSWFAAHALIGTKRIDAKGAIVVYENVFLVEATSHQKAKELAIAMAMPEVDLDDTTTLDGAPAVNFFVGIRKTILISHPTSSNLDETSPPISGTEITYSAFEVDSEEDLQKLAKGECVNVRYVD